MGMQAPARPTAGEEEWQMSTTVRQDREFLEALIPGSLLEQAIDWISSNTTPEDVFPAAALEAWARDAGFVPEEGG